MSSTRRRSDRHHLDARRTTAVLAFLVVPACGGTPAPDAPVGAAPAVAQNAVNGGWHEGLEAAGARPLPPMGLGTLTQDNITIGLESGTLLMKAVPLTEWVIRLTAPDTYRRLNGYKVRRGDEILELARRNGERGWPLVLFVSFYTRALEDSYEPLDVQVRAQNFVFRPLAVLPVTPDFNRERLRQEESQIALYLFPAEIDLDLPVDIVYQDAVGGRWDAIRSRLDRELSLVLSRAGAGKSPE